ncbi:MAG TPA: SusD/RagB family nutrient-binding outer membrane lipoprotein [Flavisolibacter sp.]|jgi:hypothetical protein
MKKILFVFSSVLLLTACRRDITNIDPKAPQTAPASALFTNAQRSLTNTITSSNVNLNIFRLITQQWTQTTYTDESNYNLSTRNIPENLWTAMYRDVLRDFEESKRLTAEQELDSTIRRNQIAVADIMQVYSWYYLVTTYGNIPYTQALDISRTAPRFDDQRTIFLDLIRRITEDIAALRRPSTSSNIFRSTESGADIIYGGNTTQWIRFANSFKLKMGMTIADAEPATARTTVESAVAGGVFASNADNAVFKYLSAPPNTNPVWVDLVQSNRNDFVVASTFANAVTSLNDPRASAFFTTDPSGGYSGGTPGESNTFETFSHAGNAITQPNAPATLLSYSEIEFYLAEAAQRGWNVGGTAVAHYNNAVTASILEWGGTEAQAATYLAQASVAYDPVNWRQRIGTQKWIALYNRGWDAWIEQRRLGYPQLTAPATAQSAYPVRFTYPVAEQNLNRQNYEQASQAIGGDVVTTRLFWDVQ